MDTKPLVQLGLHEAEIKVYLALLKRGLSTATQLAQETRLNRSHIYDKIELLIEKGLVSFVIRNNVKYFKATNPDRIIDYVKEIQENIQNLLPDLNKISQDAGQKTVVELYQGIEGLKTVLKDIIREGKNYRVLGEEGQFQAVLPTYIPQFLRDIKQKNIKEKLLSKEEQRDKITTTNNTEIRYLPDAYFSPTTTAIYGEKTAIFLWTKPHFVILIKDDNVAQSFQSYFQLLWQIAQK